MQRDVYKRQAYMEPPVWFDYGCNLFVGENFYANYNLTVLDCARVTIGDNVMLGPNVSIYTATHPLDARERASGLEKMCIRARRSTGRWRGIFMIA